MYIFLLHVLRKKTFECVFPRLNHNQIAFPGMYEWTTKWLLWKQTCCYIGFQENSSDSIFHMTPGKRKKKKKKKLIELKTAEKRWSHYELPECYPWVEQRISAAAREPGGDFTRCNCKRRRQHSAAWEPTHPGRLCPSAESLWGKHSSYLLESLSCLWKGQGWNKDFSLKRFFFF